MSEPSESFVLAVSTVQTTCSFPDCNGKAEAVMPWLTDQEHATFIWLCANHANEAMPNVDDPANPTVAPHRIPGTCRRLVAGRPCGAVVTHTVMAGGLRDERGRPVLRVTSMCKRHADMVIDQP